MLWVCIPPGRYVGCNASKPDTYGPGRIPSLIPQYLSAALFDLEFEVSADRFRYSVCLSSARYSCLRQSTLAVEEKDAILAEYLVKVEDWRVNYDDGEGGSRGLEQQVSKY